MGGHDHRGGGSDLGCSCVCMHLLACRHVCMQVCTCVCINFHFLVPKNSEIFDLGVRVFCSFLDLCGGRDGKILLRGTHAVRISRRQRHAIEFFRRVRPGRAKIYFLAPGTRQNRLVCAKMNFLSHFAMDLLDSEKFLWHTCEAELVQVGASKSTIFVNSTA